MLLILSEVIFWLFFNTGGILSSFCSKLIKESYLTLSSCSCGLIARTCMNTEVHCYNFLSWIMQTSEYVKTSTIMLLCYICLCSQTGDTKFHLIFFANWPCLFLVKQLDKVISANTAEVDWERSFYLNLIAHTSYTVTVAICGYGFLSVLLKNTYTYQLLYSNYKAF